MAAVAGAVRAVSFDATTVVLATSHGPERGVYAGHRGDLHGFRRGRVEVSTTPADDLAGELGRTWRAPSLGTHFDHGIVTPVALGLLRGARVVAVSVHEPKDGVALASALANIAAKRPTKIVFAASAHTGAALTARGPIVERSEAVELEDRVLADARADAGTFADRARDLRSIGGSCSAGSLAAFGTLFAGRPVHVRAYDRSFGVGYLVATAGA
ncbi:MAG TPA: hypothetical protein VG929_02105 [Actinomycetota bacterium]|nr:hypothetical protein [Actinomycetota bacterium]